MNYAIYRAINNDKPRVVARFRQEYCNHHAKRAARERLNDLWLRVIQHPDRYHNARGERDEFSYDYMTSSNSSDSFRFYIDNL